MEYKAEQVPLNPGAYPYQGQQQVQSTVIPMAPNVPPVRDHLPWSIFNFYMNVCCLGFVALVFSVKSRDRNVVGDVEGARQYASAARALNIAIKVLAVLSFISVIGSGGLGIKLLVARRQRGTTHNYNVLSQFS
ncbi:dispanin subfamily A member 2b-like [Scyliorhinus canicula]|uniref:dispanin subfamily A member 2b-like n=1 Tax=Scyliorhinus canicula TaxID=7830 RepID=UPI0018F37938|nr:dispanin subfamily A member 2b-like [Scyliorhinus canicula]